MDHEDFLERKDQADQDEGRALDDQDAAAIAAEEDEAATGLHAVTIMERVEMPVINPLSETPAQEFFRLTSLNYHSIEANRRYMSHSQFKSWIGPGACPARQYAILAGTHVEPEKNVFLGGRYAHVYFLENDKLDEFLANNEMKVNKWPTIPQMKKIAKENDISLKSGAKADEIYKMITDTGYTIRPVSVGWHSDFSWLDDTLAAFKRQEWFTKLIAQGEHERIITFKFEGVEWKAMLDNIRHDDQQFDDLKFMANFKTTGWDSELKRKLKWFEGYDYQQQMAMYQEATLKEFGEAYTPNILAATKEAIPNVAWEQFTRDNYDLRPFVDRVAEAMPQVMAWKDGSDPAPRCEECDFCKPTKMITRPNRPKLLTA